MDLDRLAVGAGYAAAGVTDPVSRTRHSSTKINARETKRPKRPRNLSDGDGEQERAGDERDGVHERKRDRGAVDKVGWGWGMRSERGREVRAKGRALRVREGRAEGSGR